MRFIGPFLFMGFGDDLLVRKGHHQTPKELSKSLSEREFGFRCSLVRFSSSRPSTPKPLGGPILWVQLVRVFEAT